MNAYAAVDIGSNSIRLLIAEIDNGISPLLARRRITRLGSTVGTSGLIAGESMERSLECLIDYARDMRVCGVAGYRAVATAAVRNAANRDEFIGRALNEAGITVEVISGREEARLSLNGVLSVVHPLTGCTMVFDVGGGSTEFILCRDTEALQILSVDLGAVSLTERFTEGRNPPSPALLAEMERTVEEEVSRVKTLFSTEGCKPSRLVGTAGTVTTLAAMLLELDEYDPARINGYFISRERLESLYQAMSNMTVEERAHLPGLEPGRADIICAGALIVRRIMNAFGIDGMTVSDAGLLEGILLEISGKPYH